MATIKDFKINVQQDVLDDLYSRIKNTRWTSSPEGSEWAYGTNSEYLKELVNYWQESYDWRKHEQERGE